MTLKRTLFNSEHDLFRESFKKFLEEDVKPYQEEWEADGIVPRETWKKCGDLGFLVPAAPEQYGGLGQDDFRYEAIMIEELAAINEPGLALGLHNSLVAPYLLSYGNDEQKSRFIPKIVSGECILAIAMSEPDAGSDLAGMKTKAEDRGDHWLLNGSKTFISNGILNDAVLVAAKTDPNKPHTMGLFIVERGDIGYTRGKPFKKMGQWSQDTAELFFENVKVPKKNVLGDPYKGFYYLMDKLAVERLTLCIGSIATAQAAINETVRYVKERKAFGKPISKFQNTQFKLAELQTEVTIGQVFVDRLMEAYMNHDLAAEEACGGKYWTTDLACKVVDECLQLHGGYGYMTEYPICKMFTNARVGKIYAGSNEIMKTVVAKGMGL